VAELKGKYGASKAVEVWAQDEARLGLLPIIRRVWAPRGQRPIAVARRRYQWLYLYAFVHPQSGQTEWLILPTVNTEWFERALVEFAQTVGAGPTKHIVLVVDQAGWHCAKTLRCPEGIELYALPAYSPELQPAERLWPLIREVIANRTITTLEELDCILGERCCFLAEHSNIVCAHTHYHWWPNDSIPGSIN
jgi:hypothetical protein